LEFVALLTKKERIMKQESSVNFANWFAVVICTLVAPAYTYASAPQMQTLHSFVGETDGAAPVASLVADSAGNVYGTTSAGGSKTSCLGSAQIGCGVVFELSPPRNPGGAWKETVLYRFTGGSDGAMPVAGLVFDQAGNLYGTTGEGGTFDGLCSTDQLDYGCGVVFELSPQAGGTWSESVLYAFTGLGDGYYPAANLIFDESGNLYGTSELGGNCAGCGTVFELSPNGSQGWTENTLYQFESGLDGGLPVAGLVFDQSGNLYGTTKSGGTGAGTVFELMPPTQQGQPWTEEPLYEFPGYIGAPESTLIFDAAGNLYGTASNGNGAVFELSPSANGTWNETTLYIFGKHHSSGPWAGLIADSAGNLYGTTAGKVCGSVYRLQAGSWNESELYFFSGNQTPCYPEASLTFGKWGAVYGTTESSGSCKQTDGCGTVFGILP
jgi:uncharacterized repeat protein (TIGR03803 family)